MVATKALRVDIYLIHKTLQRQVILLGVVNLLENHWRHNYLFLCL